MGNKTAPNRRAGGVCVGGVCAGLRLKQGFGHECSGSRAGEQVVAVYLREQKGLYLPRGVCAAVTEPVTQRTLLFRVGSPLPLAAKT